MGNITKNGLLKRFHAVCAANGISDENKKVIVAGYGYESSKLMTPRELADAIAGITGTGKTGDDLNTHRKRVMAVIGAYLRNNGYTESSETIKAIACRAAKTDSFNKITRGKLIDIYNEFRRKNTTNDTVKQIKEEFEVKQAQQN